MTTLNDTSRRAVLTGAMAVSFSGLLLSTTDAKAQTIDGLYDNLPMKDRILGDPNAPVTLLEYASMTCPHCKAFHENVFPSIKKKYIDAGTVNYIVRPFPFNGDRKGEAAFMLAECAPNDGYYSMMDALFKTQSKWSRVRDPVPELLRIAKMSGMTKQDFETCLRDQKLYTKMIEGRNLAARKFKVRATPTIFINSEIFTRAHSVESLSTALDEALANSS